MQPVGTSTHSTVLTQCAVKHPVSRVKLLQEVTTPDDVSECYHAKELRILVNVTVRVM